jgi:DNA modification methylase
VYRIWAKKGDVVIDPFMGWGMRGIVAYLNGLNYVGYEISPSTINELKPTFIKVMETNFFSEIKSQKLIQ